MPRCRARSTDAARRAAAARERPSWRSNSRSSHGRVGEQGPIVVGEVEMAAPVVDVALRVAATRSRTCGAARGGPLVAAPRAEDEGRASIRRRQDAPGRGLDVGPQADREPVALEEAWLRPGCESGDRHVRRRQPPHNVDLSPAGRGPRAAPLRPGPRRRRAAGGRPGPVRIAEHPSRRRRSGRARWRAEGRGCRLRPIGIGIGIGLTSPRPSGRCRIPQSPAMAAPFGRSVHPAHSATPSPSPA